MFTCLITFSIYNLPNTGMERSHLRVIFLSTHHHYAHMSKASNNPRLRTQRPNGFESLSHHFVHVPRKERKRYEFHEIMEQTFPLALPTKKGSLSRSFCEARRQPSKGREPAAKDKGLALFHRSMLFPFSLSLANRGTRERELPQARKGARKT